MAPGCIVESTAGYRAFFNTNPAGSLVNGEDSRSFSLVCSAPVDVAALAEPGRSYFVMNGGIGACRLAHADDPGVEGTHYTVPGSGGEAACQAACDNEPGCRAIEVGTTSSSSSSSEHCEIWLIEPGFTSANTSSRCLRVTQSGATARPPSHSPPISLLPTGNLREIWPMQGSRQSAQPPLAVCTPGGAVRMLRAPATRVRSVVRSVW